MQAALDRVRRAYVLRAVMEPSVRHVLQVY